MKKVILVFILLFSVSGCDFVINKYEGTPSFMDMEDINSFCLDLNASPYVLSVYVDNMHYQFNTGPNVTYSYQLNDQSITVYQTGEGSYVGFYDDSFLDMDYSALFQELDSEFDFSLFEQEGITNRYTFNSADDLVVVDVNQDMYITDIWFYNEDQEIEISITDMNTCSVDIPNHSVYEVNAYVAMIHPNLQISLSNHDLIVELGDDSIFIPYQFGNVILTIDDVDYIYSYDELNDIHVFKDTSYTSVRIDDLSALNELLTNDLMDEIYQISQEMDDIEVLFINYE